MIVFYVSGHGFGHASRDIEVINALAARAPSLPIQARTAAPRWLFDLTARTRVDFHCIEADTGLVQVDSLRIDIPESIRRATAFYATLDRRAAEEAQALLSAGTTLVVGDIPPLAFAAADRADVPSFALANFTWDWIYEEYDEIVDAPRLLPLVRAAYARAHAAWRLPMWGGFASFSQIVDVPLIARHSHREPVDVRRHLGVPLDRPLVLSSFGGFGVRGLPLDRVDCLAHCTLVVAEATVARSHPEHLEHLEHHEHHEHLEHPTRVVQISDADIYDAGYRYEDLVAAADVVMTKPGFGIIAECAANGTALVYTSRGRFREYDVLVRDMPRYVRCEFISQEDLLAGHWWPAIERVLSTPRPPKPPTDGASVVADLILAQVERT
jgi:L-arabinokinase